MKDPVKQNRRQSSDFGEIWNVQTDMKVDQDHWDNIFHNWNNPESCAGAKRPTGCLICDTLFKTGMVYNRKQSKVYSTLTAVIYKDIELYKKIPENYILSNLVFIPVYNDSDFKDFEDISIPIKILYNSTIFTLGNSTIAYKNDTISDVDHQLQINNDKLVVETGTMLHENLYIINTLIKK